MYLQYNRSFSVHLVREAVCSFYPGDLYEDFQELAVIARQIANAHTIFNITMTLIWLPLIWLLVKIVVKILPYKEKNSKQKVSSGFPGSASGLTAGCCYGNGGA